MTLKRYIVSLGLIAAAPLSLAQNNGLPGPEQSIVLLETVASRGESCGIIAPWKAAGLRAQMEMEMSGWTPERRASVAEAAARRIAGTPCDDDFLNTYLDAVSPNMETEALPPYLVAYRLMAGMSTPPHIFRATALRLDQSDIVDAIGEKLDALDASGRPPEGGKPWPDFISTTEARVADMIDGMGDDATDGRYTDEQAAALIAQAVIITHLWYMSEASTAEPAE